MVGFCGETEADHAETLAVMDEVRFDTAFMFRYSDRGITQASRKLDDDVPDAVKARRLQEVIDLQEQHTRASLDRNIGTRVQALLASPAKRGDRRVGRTRHFHPVLVPLALGNAGDLVEVTVTGSTGRTLIAGEPVATELDRQPA